MIALELAIREPDHVDDLVLANSGCRIADLAAVERFRQYARERKWQRIRAELAAVMFSDLRAVYYPALTTTVGGYVLPTPADPADVLVSLDAVRVYDATDRLGDVVAPTLVFGGTDDLYFPPSVLETTARGIPRALLSLVKGRRHAAFHERKAMFDRRVAAFLGGTPRLDAT